MYGSPVNIYIRISTVDLPGLGIYIIILDDIYKFIRGNMQVLIYGVLIITRSCLGDIFAL